MHQWGLESGYVDYGLKEVGRPTMFQASSGCDAELASP